MFPLEPTGTAEHGPSAYACFCNAILAVLALTVVTGCSPPEDGYYQPSGWQPFDYASNLPFERYVDHTRRQLEQHRVFFDDNARDQEIDWVLPFELLPPADCGEGPARGVLLVHGLLDTPFMFRDLGQALQQRCYHVRAILLPGHGTRPGDLIGVRRQDWIDAVDFGLRSFDGRVDHLSIVGFSLGGLLAANATLSHPDLDAAVLISPPLRLPYEWLASSTLPLRYVSDWLDVDPPAVAVRYRSMPSNAVAETWLLVNSYRSDARAQAPSNVPMMLLISTDDLTVDGAGTVEQFLEADDPNRRALVYGSIENEANDSRIRVIPTFLPDQMILNFSHLTLPIAPDNPLMGRKGSFRICGEHLDIVDADDARSCAQRSDNWKGELASSDDPAFRPIQRLTFNPLFDEMVDDIADFIHEAEIRRAS